MFNRFRIIIIRRAPATYAMEHDIAFGHERDCLHTAALTGSSAMVAHSPTYILAAGWQSVQWVSWAFMFNVTRHRIARAHWLQLGRAYNLEDRISLGTVLPRVVARARIFSLLFCRRSDRF